MIHLFFGALIRYYVCYRKGHQLNEDPASWTRMKVSPYKGAAIKPCRRCGYGIWVLHDLS